MIYYDMLMFFRVQHFIHYIYEKNLLVLHRSQVYVLNDNLNHSYLYKNIILLVR